MPARNKPYIDLADGTRRHLGFIPAPRARVMAVSPYRDTATLIPEKDWEPFDEWPEQIKIKDQDGKGACNGHAAATSVEVSRYVKGMDHVPISAWYIYAILCNGVDQGSMILDALELCQKDGAAPESLVDYGIINPRKLTAEAHAAAPRYKAEIGASLQSYEEIGTAVMRRQSINLSITVGSGFNNLDSDGVPPLGRGPGNHAVFCGLGLKRRSNGEVLIKMANSWTTQWGLNGFCWLPLKKVVAGSYFESYTLRAIVDDTADTSRPPKGTV
jgi:hypothetical protein